MRLGRATKLFTSWMASVAIVIATLAPSITHAFRVGAGGAWGEVCSASGPKLVMLGDGSTGSVPAPDQVHPFEHCLYCSLQPVAGLLPNSIAALPSWTALAFEVSPVPLKPPRSVFVWTGPPSRAPPLAS